MMSLINLCCRKDMMVKYFSSLGLLVAVFSLVPIEGQWCLKCAWNRRLSERDGLVVKEDFEVLMQPKSAAAIIEEDVIVTVHSNYDAWSVHEMKGYKGEMASLLKMILSY